MRRLAPVVALLAALLALGAASAQAATTTIYLLHGEQLVPVPRTVADDGPLGLEALRALLAGPTTEERAAGYRTAVPGGTTILGYLRGRNGTAIVDLSAPFALGGNAGSKSARLAQVVYTATAQPGVARLRLWVDDGPIASLGRDTRVASTISRRTLRKGGAMPVPPSGVPGPPTEAVRALQQRLVELGYLPSGILPDGRMDDRTRSAVVAFQKWERLLVDGIAGTQTLARLAIAQRPAAGAPAIIPGRRIEIDLGRQVLLLIGEDGIVMRAIPVSSGRPALPTPTGVFTVYRRVLRSWSVPFQEWMPYALYFAPGLPIRGATTVPLAASSRGSVKVPWDLAAEIHAFGVIGTPVVIRAA